MALGVSSGGSAAAEPADTVSVENLGTGSEAFPVTASGLIDDTMFVVSRHMSLRPGVVAGFDPDDGSLTHQEEVVVEGEPSHGTWGATVSGEELYIGMSFDGPRRSSIMRLDPVTGALDEVGSTAPARVIWDMATAPDGTIYAVTSRQNNAGLWEHDPDDGSTEFLGHFQDDVRQDARSVAATQDTVFIGLGNASADLIAYDRHSEDSTSILPSELDEATYIYALEASEDVLAAGTRGPATLTVMDPEDPEDYEVHEVPTGTVQALEIVEDTVYFTSGSTVWRQRIGEDAPEQIAELDLPGGQTRGLYHRDGILHGVGNLGHLWSVEVDDGSWEVLDLAPAQATLSGGADRSGVHRTRIRQGEPAQSLVATPEAVFTGGHFTLGVRDLVTGEADQVSLPGEPKGAVAVGDRLYLAMYSSGELLRYDVDTQEQEVVAQAPEGHNRPRALAHDEDTGRLVMAVQADSGGGGSVLLHDPADGGTQILEPFQGRSASAVAADGGLAYVAGSTGMQDDEAPAEVIALDLRTGEVLWRTTPVPDSGVITGLAVDGDRLHGLTADGQTFVMDTGTQRVAARSEAPGPGDLLLHRGDVYGASDDQLYRVDSETAETEVLLDDLEGEWFTWPGLASDGSSLYVMSGNDVLKVGGGPAGQSSPEPVTTDPPIAVLVLSIGGAAAGVVVLVLLRARRRRDARRPVTWPPGASPTDRRDP
ncbi:PQQ-binding-like beta-propeller repeat protein [Nesterenkonia sp. CL21]|uniref:outer membrane protein assembly factor BamB family protein n=1 Tax=Nesterenkonia sp. CL21 TaxID=3064894 RepID=UPI002878C520|nr:PQQ-binding-like beta-propeller repeat protein [Nesterenkonia sp. CL21]MDS2174061.1 PQQ-binding-like beta-propeller repeat protein [Nesterenkonia sp. CL21]